MELNDSQEITMKAAQVAYEAYANHTLRTLAGSSSHVRDAPPTWEELPANACSAWFASTEGVLEYLAALNHNGT